MHLEEDSATQYLQHLGTFKRHFVIQVYLPLTYFLLQTLQWCPSKHHLQACREPILQETCLQLPVQV